MSKRKVYLITSDREVIAEVSKHISKDYSVIPRIIANDTGIEVLKKLLRSEIIEVLGVESGSIEVNHVIIDSEFLATGNKAYFIDNPLFEDLPDGANSAIAMLMGGGISVVVRPNSSDFTKGWSLGKRRVILLSKISSVTSLLNNAFEQLPFSMHTLQVENEFAPVYDKEELSGAATVSAILWENEFTISQVLDYVRHSTDSVRILDLGCGTGRFEEILFKDPVVSAKINTIYAVDFAPQYLVEAKKRLKQILPSKHLKKIHFIRRIAESLHWPENYFDIVIAGFGVVCFSKSYLTLQEIYKVLKPKGLVVVNGYNRDAATYEFDYKMKEQTGRSASHFAIRIDREENIMHLGNAQIDCFTFDSHGLETLFKQIRFKPKKDSTHTFPSLYGTSRKDYLQELAKRTRQKTKNISNSKSASVASYEQKNLLQDQYKSGFNEILQLIDKDLALVMPHRGFYFCTAANK